MESVVYREETGNFGTEEQLQWQVKLPLFTGSKKAVKRLERYYQRVETVWKKRWEEVILPQYSTEVPEGKALWALSLEGEFVELEDNICSVALTVVEKTRKKVKDIYFFADLWQDGIPILEKQRSPFIGHKKKEIIDEIQRQAQEREYFFFLEDYLDQIKQYFSYENVYFQQEGVEVFFPQGTIAREIEGVAKFFLPYSLFH